MECSSCGKPIQAGVKKCKNCGKEIERSAHQPNTEQKKLQKEKKNLSYKGTQIVFVIVVACFLAGIVYHFLKPTPPNPSAPPPAYTENEDTFFITLHKEVREIGEARSYFKRAEDLRKNTDINTNDSSVFLNMSQDYSRAAERFKHAKQALEIVKNSHLDESKQVCQKEMSQILEKYIHATEIFDENAKVLSQGDKERAPKDLMPDAQAKYELAEKLMGEFLANPCRGSFFKYMNTQSNTEKQEVYFTYQSFYGIQFPSQEGKIQNLLNYKPRS